MNSGQTRAGRPRSESARAAVLHAVDDLLVEIGYAEMTMKNIAERAGVSRQTVYRWWSTKAEILFEATAADAVEEMSTEPLSTPQADITAYLEALVEFLARSPAGAAYRTLVGEAQYDREVAELLASKDVLGDSARTVITRALGPTQLPVTLDQASAQLVGPVLFWVLSGRDAAQLDLAQLTRGFLHALRRDSPGSDASDAPGAPGAHRP